MREIKIIQDLGRDIYDKEVAAARARGVPMPSYDEFQTQLTVLDAMFARLAPLEIRPKRNKAPT